MPSARQKRHQTVSMKLADCQDSCRVFVLTSRSDHVIVYATAKLIMDGGLPNYRPTRLNDSGNFFRPLTKNRRFFHIFIFYLNSPNHALHSCILLGVFLVGKSYWISIFKVIRKMANVIPCQMMINPFFLQNWREPRPMSLRREDI